MLCSLKRYHIQLFASKKKTKTKRPLSNTKSKRRDLLTLAGNSPYYFRYKPTKHNQPWEARKRSTTTSLLASKWLVVRSWRGQRRRYVISVTRVLVLLVPRDSNPQTAFLPLFFVFGPQERPKEGYKAGTSYIVHCYTHTHNQLFRKGTYQLLFCFFLRTGSPDSIPPRSRQHGRS